MSRNSLFSLITFGFLAIFTASCSSNSSIPANSTSPSPSASPAAAASPAATFNNPVVASKDEAQEKADKEAKDPNAKAADEDNISGLLPASESDSIVRSTTKGRSDPFAKVALPVVVTSSNNKVANSGFQPAKMASNAGTLTISTAGSKSTSIATTSNATPRAIGIATSSTTSKVGSGLGAASVAKLVSATSKPSQPNSVTVPGSLAVKPTAIKPSKTPFRNPFLAPSDFSKPDPEAVRPQQVAIRDIPKPLQPDLARAVSITGVAQVNGQTQVILKLPNESFSRYVSVGERVMDGRILVKRVQEFSGMTPVVVLEELGIEVPRKVGEKGAIAAKEAPAPQK